MGLSLFQELIFQTNQALSFSLQFAGLFEILSSLQIAHLIIETITFSIQNTHFGIHGLIHSIPYFTGAYRLESSADKKSLYYSIWFIFVFYLSFYILLYFFSLLLVSRKKSFNKRFLKAFSLLNLLHSRVFFFPIQYFLFNLIALYRGNLKEENSFYLGKGWMITTIGLVIINNGLALIKEFAFCHINQTKNYYDVKTHIHHQVIIVCKSIVICLIHEDMNNTGIIKALSIYLFLILTCLVFLDFLFKVQFNHIIFSIH